MAGAVLGVVYLITQWQRGLKLALDAGGEVLVGAQTRAANVIEQFFPLVNSSSLITHAVTFPDGSRHAVPGETVASDGSFLYQGARYRLMVNSTGQKIAVRL